MTVIKKNVTLCQIILKIETGGSLLLHHLQELSECLQDTVVHLHTESVEKQQVVRNAEETVVGIKNTKAGRPEFVGQGHDHVHLSG